jgi:hypothetical protein
MKWAGQIKCYIVLSISIVHISNNKNRFYYFILLNCIEGIYEA